MQRPHPSPLARATTARPSPAVTGIAQRALLKQRDAITNWAAFAAANNISGWDEASDPCTWSGITCNATTGHVITV